MQNYSFWEVASCKCQKVHFPPDNTRNFQTFITLTLTGNATTVKKISLHCFVKMSRKHYDFKEKNYLLVCHYPTNKANATNLFHLAL